MLSSALICAVILLVIGWTKEIAGLFGASSSTLFKIVATGIGVASIYALDFAVNAVQSTDRALIVDTLPQSEQSTGNAWAGIMQGLGSVVMFWIGNTDLSRTRIFTWLGTTQLKSLAIICALFLLSLQGLTSWAVSERVLVHSTERDTIGKVFKKLWFALRHLPKPIRQICIIQFFNTAGWFPIMFFAGPVWIGETYIRNHISSDGEDLEDLRDAATRAGSRALFVHSLFALMFSLILPLLIESGDRTRAVNWIKPIPGLSLPLLWITSQALFCFIMFITPLAQTVFSCTVLLAILGFSLALTVWAPYSLIGEQIRLGLEQPSAAGPLPNSRSSSRLAMQSRASGDESSSSSSTKTNEDRRKLLGPSLDDEDLSDFSLEAGRSVSSEEEDQSKQAGIILGILNIYVVMPQFIVTIVSSLIFHWLEPGPSQVHVDPAHDPTSLDPSTPADGIQVGTGRAMTVILQLGGLSAGYAAYLGYQFCKVYSVQMAALSQTS